MISLLTEQNVEAFERCDQGGRHPTHAGAENQNVDLVVPAHHAVGFPAGEKSVGSLPLFGGREVTCGFTGAYSADAAEVNGTALVGKTSVVFHARLQLRSEF